MPGKNKNNPSDKKLADYLVKHLIDGQKKEMAFHLARGDAHKGLLESLPAAAEDEMWAIASMETVDTAGDIVRADGMGWDSYHCPPTRHLKIMAGHLRILESGEPPIVGRVEELRRVTASDGEKLCKAIAFRMSYAKDAKGKLTKLSQAYKDLFDGGYMDSFSVGMMVDEYDVLTNEKGEYTGLDILKSSLFEISAVAIPCLAQANVIKELGSDAGDPGDLFVFTAADGKQYVPMEGHKQLMDKLAAIAIAEGGKQKSHDEDEDEDEDEHDKPDLMRALTEVATCMRGMEAKVEQMIERIELVESALVLLSDSKSAAEPQPEPQPQPQPEPQKQAPDDSLKDLRKDLDNLKRYLSR